MSKRLLSAVLISAVVIYAVVFTWSLLEYQRYAVDTFELYEELGVPSGYIDVYPYYQWNYGGIMVGIGFVVFVLCAIGGSIAFKGKRKRKQSVITKMLVSLMLFVPLLTIANIEPVQAIESPYVVNTLLYFDEECTNEDDRYGWWDILFESINIWAPYWRFKDNFNIEFKCLNGWNSFWDSDYTENSRLTLLDEAIEKIGFESGMMYETSANHFEVVDLLICISGQDMDGRGLSPPEWNAVIMTLGAGSHQYNIPLHELSHQFWCEHCGNFCVMNTFWTDTMWNWCGDCWNCIYNHRDKWHYKYNLSVSVGIGGKTEPYMGSYVYREGIIEVTAVPDVGYVFDYWLLDGATMYGNPITVTMNSDHTLKAYFEYSGGGGGGGGACPTLFVWNGTDYVEEGFLNIHTESDVTVRHEIQNTLALENGVYKLQLRELDEYASHIDQVRLYAVDGEGEWHSCPITYAYHNELGKVKKTLRFDDDTRVDLKPTEVIGLKFAPSILYDKTEYFIFEINGYNEKMMW